MVFEQVVRVAPVAEVVGEKVPGANVAEVVLLGGVAGIQFSLVGGSVDCGSACRLELIGEEVAEAGEFEGA